MIFLKFDIVNRGIYSTFFYEICCCLVSGSGFRIVISHTYTCTHLRSFIVVVVVGFTVALAPVAVAGGMYYVFVK